MVGLVRHRGLNPWRLMESHQVLAYAYEVNGDAVTLGIYDPNWPARDDVILRLEAAMITQTPTEPVSALLTLP
jgi:hypothetical protein